MVFLLWCAGLTAAAQFAKIGVVLPDLDQTYPDAGASLGFLVSILSLLGAVLGLVAGMIVARAGFRSVLLGALGLGAALSFYQTSLPSFELMLVSRFVEGISHMGIVVAAPTLIAQISAGRLQSAAMALWGTFFGVAFALTAVFGVPLVARFGLSALFGVHGMIMALICGLLFLTLPKDQPAPIEGSVFNPGTVLRRHLEVFTSPFMSAAALGWLFYTLTYVSLVSILPDTVAVESRVFVATFMPIAGIACALTLGVFLLRFLSGVAVSVLGFSLTLGLALLLLIVPGNPVICVALFFATGLIQAGGFAAIPQLNKSAAHRAYANGALAQMGNMGNLIGTPLLLGLLVYAGFETMMGVVVLIYAVAIAVHLLLARQRRKAA